MNDKFTFSKSELLGPHKISVKSKRFVDFMDQSFNEIPLDYDKLGRELQLNPIEDVVIFTYNISMSSICISPNLSSSCKKYILFRDALIAEKSNEKTDDLVTDPSQDSQNSLIYNDFKELISLGFNRDEALSIVIEKIRAEKLS